MRIAILSSFGILSLLCAQVSGQTVTGSGTSGTVPEFTGTSTIGSSPISISGSNVGIGNTAPSQPLTIGTSTWSTAPEQAIYIQETGFAEPSADNTNSTGDKLVLWNSNISGTYLKHAIGVGPYELWVQASGNSNAHISFFTGPTAGAAPTEAMRISSGGMVGIGTTSPGAPLEVNGNLKLTSGSGASVTYADGTTQSTAWTGVLCGGDYAESVDVSGDRTHYGPGDVLVIDPDAVGKFLKSAEPYSTAVLGVYSTKPGVLGRHQTGPASPEEVPMAMVGIVPTKVSAENGAIRPGDLLVTASIPGYVMKGTDRSRMLGAVVGKAMDSLDSGTGVIEVGVTLQ